MWKQFVCIVCLVFQVGLKGGLQGRGESTSPFYGHIIHEPMLGIRTRKRSRIRWVSP
jgi:hypothetical protein